MIDLNSLMFRQCQQHFSNSYFLKQKELPEFCKQISKEGLMLLQNLISCLLLRQIVRIYIQGCNLSAYHKVA